MSSLAIGMGIGIPYCPPLKPYWQSLVEAAEAAAAAAGASLWYVPPESYAARATYGPFVNSDTSGGNPTVGSGLVGYLKDRGGSNNATQATTANKPVLVTAPGAAASALGFAALSFDGTNDRLGTPALASQPANETMIAVARVPLVTGNRSVLERRNAAFNGGMCLRFLSQQPNFTAITTAGYQVLTRSTGFSPGDWVVMEGNAGSAGVTCAFNGLPASSSPTGTYPGVATTEGLFIGATGAGGFDYYDGPLALACYAPVNMSETQRAPIRALGRYLVGL